MTYAPARAAAAMGTFLCLLAISCAKEGLDTGGTGGTTAATGGAVSSGGAGGSATGDSSGTGGATGTGGTIMGRGGTIMGTGGTIMGTGGTITGTGGTIMETGGTIMGTGGTIIGRGGAGGHLGSGGSSGPTGGTTTTPDAGPQGCVANGRTYAIGEGFPIDCNTCTCTAYGIACTAMACFHDAAADEPAGPDGGGICSLSANLTFGHDGGNALYQDTNRLTPAGLTITRDYSLRAGRDGATTASCSPSVPACGTADAVTVATINADLADADVQAVWRLPQSPVPLFGTDPRPMDGTVYAIALDDGHQVLVGGQCASPAMSSCRSIPAGLLRLAQDLQKLAAAGLADPLCKVL